MTIRKVFGVCLLLMLLLKSRAEIDWVGKGLELAKISLKIHLFSTGKFKKLKVSYINRNQSPLPNISGPISVWTMTNLS